MKILFYSWEFGPGTGGIGQYLYQMTKGLSRLGHECIVVTGREHIDSTSKEEDIAKIYRLYDRGEVRSQRITSDVLEIAKKHNVDFIEGTDHWGECQGIICAKNRPKVLIKLHSCQYLKKIEEVSAYYWWQKVLIKMARLRIRSQINAERYCIENADGLIAPSKQIFEAYRKQGARLPAKTALVPNILHELPDLKAGCTTDKPTILFSGRLEILKGIQYLPAIMEKVVKEVPDVVVEIAGDDQYARGIGSLKEWLEKQFGPLNKSVRFLGKLNSTQMADAYRKSWLLIFPTKWDNFPMSVLEAMAHGKPVVTTSSGGMQEMLVGTGAPIEAPDSDAFSQAIVTLLSNAKMRSDIGDACRKRVIDHYTPRHVIPKYLNFVETCL